MASNIIGATTMEQLKTNIDSINVEITPELEARINAIHQVHNEPGALRGRPYRIEKGRIAPGLSAFSPASATQRTITFAPRATRL